MKFFDAVSQLPLSLNSARNEGGGECLSGNCIEGWPAVAFAGLLGFTLFGSGAIFLARMDHASDSEAYLTGGEWKFVLKTATMGAGIGMAVGFLTL